MTDPGRPDPGGRGRVTTDPARPLRQGAYRSHLRDERLAAVLGAALGVLFTTCFVTGLYSHVLQRPPSWLSVPPRPAGLYRVTQGVHVAAGIASVPVLLAKLWVVWPRLLSWPPVHNLAHAVERIGILPLVAGAVFMVFSGVANIAQWYPWRFSFLSAHFWMAWVTTGALVAHTGAKWATTRRSLARPSSRPGLAEADEELGTTAEPDREGAYGLSRRGFLGTTAAAGAVLTVVTVGQTVTPLRRLALLAPRDPGIGPQGRPVNRGAANAGVVDLARSPDYRLVVEGRVREPLAFDLEALEQLSDHTAHLPIVCVEGWSFSAAWRGARVRDVLAMAGAEAGRPVVVESLEPVGVYRRSVLSPAQAADRDALLATHLDGHRLALDHGYPCRLIAPNRPGVLQTKWVTRIEVA